jgi:hypothetical protein
MTSCARCQDIGWVCENHPDRPAEGEHACSCGGAGMLCPACNVPEDPGVPKGFKTKFDKRGWHH